MFNHYVILESLRERGTAARNIRVQTGWNQVDRKRFRASCAYHRRPKGSYGFLKLLKNTEDSWRVGVKYSCRELGVCLLTQYNSVKQSTCYRKT